MNDPIAPPVPGEAPVFDAPEQPVVTATPIPPAEAEGAAPEVRPAPPGQAPAEGYERLPVLDLLRGIAILGILPANMPHFYGPGSGFGGPPPNASLIDRVVVGLTLFFVDGKFITLLSILFGAGLAIQAMRAEATNRPFARYYIRRQVLLFALGLAHTLLLWFGDILTTYALVGMVALLFTYLSQRAVLWSMAVFLARGYAWFLLIGGIALVVLALRGFGVLPPESPPADGQAAQAAASSNEIVRCFQECFRLLREYSSPDNTTRIYREGAFWEMVLNRALWLVFYYAMFVIMIAWYVLGCFLVGVYLMRRGVFHDLDAHRRFVRWVLLLGLGVGFGLHIVAVILYAIPPPTMFPFLLNFLGALPLALGYFALVLFWSRSAWLPWLQRTLQAVGQMALTNYLMQSVLCGLIFYGYGLGLYGRMNRAEALIVVALVWAAELVWSPIWMRYFQAGPVEWAWRSLADWRLRPILRRASNEVGPSSLPA